MKSNSFSYHGGKPKMGKKIEHKVHCESPRDVQTRGESSKSMGIDYQPSGTMDGKVARGR